MTASTIDLNFVHPPLDLSIQQVRFLTLHHEDEPDIIKCTLEVGNVVKDSCVGLSYAWGSDEPTHEILINGKSFHVRQNLFDFLKQRRREIDQDKLWIDAIYKN